MSRIEFKNDTWRLAIGVDQVTSAFLQIWSSNEDAENALVIIDNMGVTHAPLGKLASLPHDVLRLLGQTTERFEHARSRGNPYPNLDAETICKFARLLNLGGHEADIYAALD